MRAYFLAADRVLLQLVSEHLHFVFTVHTVRKVSLITDKMCCCNIISQLTTFSYRGKRQGAAFVWLHVHSHANAGFVPEFVGDRDGHRIMIIRGQIDIVDRAIARVTADLHVTGHFEAAAFRNIHATAGIVSTSVGRGVLGNRATFHDEGTTTTL